MDLVLTSENIHLLTFLTQKTKSIRVIDSHTLSEVRRLSPQSDLYISSSREQNLYAISELAQHKIRTRAVRHGWATNAYPGQITLPSDIFKTLPSPEVANKVHERASQACVLLMTHLLRRFSALFTYRKTKYNGSINTQKSPPNQRKHPRCGPLN